MAWTLTPTRRVPSLVSSSVSAAGLAEFVAFKMKRLPQRRWPGGKISVTRFPKNVRMARREIFPPAGLTITARASRVKRSKTIFETSHYGFRFFAHRAENFVHTAQLLSNLPRFSC